LHKQRKTRRVSGMRHVNKPFHRRTAVQPPGDAAARLRLPFGFGVRYEYCVQDARTVDEVPDSRSVARSHARRESFARYLAPAVLSQRKPAETAPAASMNMRRLVICCA